MTRADEDGRIENPTVYDLKHEEVNIYVGVFMIRDEATYINVNRNEVLQELKELFGNEFRDEMPLPETFLFEGYSFWIQGY